MRKRGFTLIEVLIALVIFVIGALAVIRIFPPAFNVVQNSGYSTVATRMSDSILSQMKADGSTPDAVFDINVPAPAVDWKDRPNWATNPAEFSWQDQNGAVVGTTDKNGSLPKGPSDTAYNASALGHFRFIRGEKHEVQVASVTVSPGNVTNEPYILTNFPYDVYSGVRVYIELAVSGVTINSNGELDFTHAAYKDPKDGTTKDFHSTGTHPNRPLSPIPIIDGADVPTRSPIPPTGVGAWVDSGTRYYVSYQWRYNSSANPSGNTVIDAPVNIPDNHSTAWSGGDAMRVLQGAIINNDSTSNRTIIAGPVPVKVRINLGIASGNVIANFPNYFPPDAASPFSDLKRNNWGYLGFVPILANPTDPTHTLPANLPVYVDYLVPDWRTIYDQSVSVRSTPEPPYHGEIFTPIRLLAPNPSPLGLLIDPTNSQLPKVITATIPASNKGQINYPNFNAHIRTAYKGLDQWARQISPSAVSYIPYVSVGTVQKYRGVYLSTGGNAVTTSYSHVIGDPDLQEYILPREPWREYYWDPSKDANIIYFHASDAGKSVRVSFVDTSGNTVSNQLLTIDKAVTEADITADFAPVRDVSNNTLAYVSKLELPAKASSILGISGVGVIARTAWLDGSQYRQSEVTGYRLANAH